MDVGPNFSIKMMVDVFDTVGTQELFCKYGVRISLNLINVSKHFRREP